MSLLIQNKVAQVNDLYSFQSLFRRYANKLSGYQILDVMIDEAMEEQESI